MWSSFNRNTHFAWSMVRKEDTKYVIICYTKITINTKWRRCFLAEIQCYKWWKTKEFLKDIPVERQETSLFHSFSFSFNWGPRGIRVKEIFEVFWSRLWRLPGRNFCTEQPHDGDRSLTSAVMIYSAHCQQYPIEVTCVGHCELYIASKDL